MNSSSAAGLRKPVLWLLTLGIPLFGCGNGVLVTQEDAVHDPPAPPGEDPFLDPPRQPIEADGVTVFSGQLPSPSHLGTWDLGAVMAGTRLAFDVAGFGSDFSIGLFDENQQVLMLSHSRRGSKDPYAVLDVTQDAARLYLVVSSDPKHASDGPYSVTVTHASGMAVEAPETQEVILNFSGGQNVYIGSVVQGTVPAFDAAAMDPGWAGLTDEIKQVVRDHLIRIYDGLSVRFFFWDDPDRPEHGSMVYFGGTHTNNVGLAASVDYGNRFKDQAAIVYTENFAKYIAYGYSHVDIARGFANVAAHELGHLLGLNHTDLPADVMNVSPTVSALMAPQYFMETAALDPAVFLTGMQDGAERIYSTVGGDWGVVVIARQRSATHYAQLLPEPANVRLAASAVADLATLGSGHNCDSVEGH